MTAPVIYGYPRSTFVRTACMACVEKGVEYSLDAFESFEFRGAEHYELHPFAKMPVLRHDDIILFETLAICMYVDETFEGPGLVPEKLADRCRMFQWVSMINDGVYHALVRKWILPHSRDQEMSEGMESRLRGEARDALARIQEHCDGGNYLVGVTPSLADLFLIPVLAYAIKLDPDILGGLDALSQVWSEMSARESFVRTMA